MFYIDQAGNICNTDSIVAGVHYNFIQKPTYTEIQVVITATGEVHEEYQGWKTLEELKSVLSETYFH